MLTNIQRTDYIFVIFFVILEFWNYLDNIVGNSSMTYIYTLHINHCSIGITQTLLGNRFSLIFFSRWCPQCSSDAAAVHANFLQIVLLHSHSICCIHSYTQTPTHYIVDVRILILESWAVTETICFYLHSIRANFLDDNRKRASKAGKHHNGKRRKSSLGQSRYAVERQNTLERDETFSYQK